MSPTSSFAYVLQDNPILFALEVELCLGESAVNTVTWIPESLKIWIKYLAIVDG